MEYDLLSATQRDEIITKHLREFLPPLGLAEITPRTWVDGSQPPVRRIFELSLLKGAAVKACWGFSLDFVPHISGGKVRWHRSDKTARLDVIVDLKNLPQPSYIHDPGRLAADLRKLLPEAVSKAQEFWERGKTYHGMLGIIREIREHHINCFDYCNYTQLPLAFAFLSAMTGDLQSAEQELDHYALTHKLDEVEAFKLEKLARDCA